MNVKHSKQIAAKCPVDNSLDIYKLVIKTHRVIKVEDIILAIGECTKEPIFQEDLTFELAKRLKCNVKLIGTHSGFKTITTWGEA